ncbi:MAG: phosphoribosylformylglycinamidine synthase I [Candidatus Buchananbacteria bacterium CG10_big_fil_rev_8_21_14_0_10_42_9]|uniref:Phosphoribosylformylglycinamidine synthase subunit PurQ n=1 Tax=Candidatus Buchananbacteria bacterium CG10_big_fil_rev_8_21_14_0_10_42_9 TaxID=1974526 RepID=A0A2H0W0I8_9BACT|nr:MAG: phosphoribosylformylglycinamidine synthase I [Candidatus Buchananbacteria bacterium CG10_big_fil_rev_8_21_14_0_10_42_9]
MKPKVIVLKTDGSNCEEEMNFAFNLAGAESEIIHINELFAGDKKLKGYQILALPGGFTYGDDVMAGKLLANQLLYKLGKEIKQFTQADKLVLGVCNGFQVLVRTGLLPFGGKPAEDASLIINDNAKFMSQWEGLVIQDSKCVFTVNLAGRQIEYPIAHGEGKFIIKDNDVLERLKENNQIVFKYTGNPNGSVEDIAGVCDQSGKILGLMPHPERFVQKTQHYNWRGQEIETPHGLPIFQNAVNYFKS